MDGTFKGTNPQDVLVEIKGETYEILKILAEKDDTPPIYVNFLAEKILCAAIDKYIEENRAVIKKYYKDKADEEYAKYSALAEAWDCR